MTQEEFNAIFSEDPSSDAVMSEINRLWEENTRLNADFAAADAERHKLQQDLDEANKRYRSRFMSGEKTIDEGSNKTSYDSLFKEV
jgi:chromosome segregation ATPase